MTVPQQTAPAIDPHSATERARPLPRWAQLLWRENALMQPRPWLQLAAALALLLYGFFGIGVDAIPDKSAQLAFLFGLIMLAVYGGPAHTVSLRRSGIVWLAVAAIGVALLSWVGSWILHPHWAESSFKVHRVTGWFAMIPVAVILGGRARNVRTLWLTALAGLICAPWIAGGGFAEWQRGFAGERVDFGLHNAQHTAMFYGAAALGLLAFAPRILRSRSDESKASKASKASTLRTWLIRVGWVLAIAFCVTAVVLTQTRGVWLGFIVALLVLCSRWLLLLNRRFKSRRRYIFTGTLITALLALGIGFSLFGEVIEHRLEADRQTLTLLQRGQFDDIPYTSTGVRLHTWAEALQWIRQRPLIGWGGNGRSLIFDHSENLPADIRQRFGHLHNSYLDLTVNFGLLGLAVLGALAYWLLSRTQRYFRAGQLRSSEVSFAVSFTVFFAVINGFESYLFYDSGRLLLAIVGGGMVTRLWAAQRRLAAGENR